MNRRFFRTLGAALLMASCMSVPAWAETAQVTGSDVNMREGPGTNYRILDCLPWGTTVTVTDRSDDTWYAVEVDGETGFMSAQFLRIQEQEQAQQSLPQPQANAGQTAYVNAMYVRVRSGPGSGYSVLGEYNRGKQLTLYGVSDGWASCAIDGREGYIYAGYVSLDAPENVEIEKPSPTPAPTPAPAPETPEVEYGTPDWARPDATPPARIPSPTPAPAATGATQVAAPAAQTIGEGIIKGDYVRFRTGPGSNYQIIDVYDYGQPLEIVGVSDGWTGCLIDGQFGYVHSAYVEVSSYHEPSAPQPTGSSYTTPSATPAPVVEDAGDTNGYIAGNNVRMRSGASMSSGIITELFYGNRVTIVGTYDDFTGIFYQGVPGFVYSQFVKEGALSIEGSTVTGSAYAVPGSEKADQQTAQLTGTSYEKGQQVAQYALQFLGYNYSWGGKDPSTGFDCSGLVYYVYSQFGYSLNRVAQDQARNGVAVSADALQPGDILCFYSGSSYIGHVGIYIGDGMFVHAQNSATGVVITDLSGHYGQRGFEARRIVS